ncbi:MAG TPA: sterol desaturase family protein [Phnomibacter sp.]|nr:sterol desaturase family protein [Phnomibacter sp.]
MKQKNSTPRCMNRTRLILAVVIPALLPLGAMAFFKWLPAPVLKYFLFTKGIMAWTLTEYSIHRWAYHTKKEKANQERDMFNHLYHHTHPGDMLITPWMRLLALAAFGFAIWSLVAGPVLLTYLTGFVAGLAAYSLMHYFLHQPIAATIIPKLVKQHIWHHTKYSNKCFGVCTTFWDRVFKTQPAEFRELPETAIRFYYKHEDAKANDVSKIVRKLCAGRMAA